LKVLVFLYPIKEYFDASIGRRTTSEFDYYDSRYLPERLIQIVDRRYRRKGYKIVWIMFSSKENKSKPDCDQLSEFITIDDSDVVAANGVTFSDHCTLKLYPDPANIISCLPVEKDDVSDLVIAGFHMWDCVDKLASYAHDQGFPVKVDQDLTEHYFSRTLVDGKVPFVRRIPAYVEILRSMDEYGQELWLEARQNRPWLEKPGSL